MALPRDLSRRSALATGAGLLGTSLAGCSMLDVNKGATDVVLRNEATTPLSVTLTVTDDGAATPRLAETVTLEPSAVVTPTNDDKLPVSADYSVEVAVEGGPSETYEWTDVQLDLAPLHVILDGSSNILFALQVG